MSNLSRLGGLAVLVVLGAAAAWRLAGYVTGNLNPQPEPPGITASP
jgi:hypothetical protein